ncbi:hypothetical protein [Lacticaseibacillus mingshuiensis]|uniref:hypothetical protein n=1 Tax=Lacticaseibacillus mingshuiensis TaxID=2799574 RepID=UPI001952983D|nr:hypothetical protein [Lacticaseibacillus mingshuiensis]
MASEETKQDVFKELHDAAEDVALFDLAYLDQVESRYAAALPDGIVTLPADVGERIKLLKARYLDLVDAFSPLKDYAVMRSEPSDQVQAWMLHNSAAFARAWLDGVWIEEESGKVVRA